MAFKVKLFAQGPDYEALHVAKITCFPLERRDYKPYSQARICFAQDGLHVQLLSFEAIPFPDSAICAVFRFAHDRAAISLRLFADGRLAAPQGVTAHTFTGEDLQGMFWGGNLFVPTAALRPFFGGFAPVAGAAFHGNLYKLCENDARAHYGCYYPADFAVPLDAAQNMGDFIVIDY